MWVKPDWSVDMGTYYRWHEFGTKYGEVLEGDGQNVISYATDGKLLISDSKPSISEDHYVTSSMQEVSIRGYTSSNSYNLYGKYVIFPPGNGAYRLYYGVYSSSCAYMDGGGVLVYRPREWRIQRVKDSSDDLGFVYSSDGSAYPDGGTKSHWYYEGKTSMSTPGTPSSISIGGTVKAGKNVSINWGDATKGSASISGYILQRKVNSGSWTQVYKGSNKNYTDTAQSSWNTVAYRVCAYDVNDFSGDYKTSDTSTVIHNNVPTIDGADSDLGSFSTTIPVVSYVVNDVDGDTVNVTVAFDNTTKKTHEVTLGQTNTFTFTSDEWVKILNGSHTIKLTADDGEGGTAIRQYTFTKNVTSMSFTLTKPLDADDTITGALETLNAVIPDGAILTIEVCNNGYDTSPTWQDVTSRVLNGEQIFITNAQKTADKWGYNIRVTVDRNGASGDCYISGIAGFFE